MTQQQPIQTQPVQTLQQQTTQSQPVQQQPTHSQPVQQQPTQVQHIQPAVEYDPSPQHLPIQAQSEVVQAHQPQPQTQVQASSITSQSQQQQQQPSAGPPYIYDPNTTYADPNVQAWAQYYAQGGKDLAGSVYFLSIPGLTDNHAPGPRNTDQTEAAQQAHQHQEQHSANEISGHQPLDGYNNTSAQQQQPQPYQTQLSGADATTSHQQEQQEQSSQVHELQPRQLSQYQKQPQYLQDQIHPQPHSQPQSRSQSLNEYDYAAQNSYLQQQPLATDGAGSKQSSPTRTVIAGLERGGSLSAGGIGRVQSTSATPSWVLPKKTPPATVAGGSPNRGDVGGSGLLGQFGGISLSNPGRRTPPSHGAGTLA